MTTPAKIEDPEARLRGMLARTLAHPQNGDNRGIFLGLSVSEATFVLGVIDTLRAQRAAALDACDRMMLGELSPSYIVAFVRDALGWQMPPLTPRVRPFIGCQLPVGDKWCRLKIEHPGDCEGVDKKDLPPSADDPSQERGE